MPSKDILKKIKSQGFVRVIIKPIIFDEIKIKSVRDCKSLIEKSIVILRGWDYPHWPQNPDHDYLEIDQDFIESGIDWGGHKELWRFYQSAQFVHYFAIFEDWFEEDLWRDKQTQDIQPNTILDITSTVYSLTEIFEFAFRLTKPNFYQEGFNVEITFYRLNNRSLHILSPGRMPLIQNYICHTEKYAFTRNFNQIDMEDRRKIAIEVVQELFSRFGWDNQPISIFESDQRELIGKR